MKATNRAKIGDTVKCGFLNFVLVGHVNNGRLVRNGTGTKFYWQINYGGLHEVNLDADVTALTTINNAAQFDPVVASYLNNLRRHA